MTDHSQEDVAMCFEKLTVYRPHLSLRGDEEKYLLKDVSGYLKRGSVTAVLGPSASGKSVLLQALSGNLHSLDISGKMVIDSIEIDPGATKPPVVYVPQGDSLVGDLTTKEVCLDTAKMKINESTAELEKKVLKLLDDVGLGHVQNTIIGTPIFRGLSGGQKKRAETASELVAAPSILLLDEPTSGLDSKVAYDILKTLKDLVQEGDVKHSVMVSIHQPNEKILSIFDNILILEGGSSIYFGSVARAREYFAGLGFPCPERVTPTDYYLQIADTSFSHGVSKKEINFAASFAASELSAEIHRIFEGTHELSMKITNMYKQPGDGKKQIDLNVPRWKRIYTLVYREYTLAARDPTLYYFQAVLLMSFAFLSGAVFWMIPRSTSQPLVYFNSGLLWIVFCYVWVHAFKVYYLSSATARATFEISNYHYTPLDVLISDTIATSTLGVMFFAISPITYFMVGYPVSGYPLIILIQWLTFIAGEAMIAAVSMLSTDPVQSMIYAQICLVCLEVFGGGSFIPWNEIPAYWDWLKNITIFYHSSLAMMITVYDVMDLDCNTGAFLAPTTDFGFPEGTALCPAQVYLYPCDKFTVNAGIVTSCTVSAREALYQTQGIGTDLSVWVPIGALIAIFVAIKIVIAIFTYYPTKQIYYQIDKIFTETFANNSKPKFQEVEQEEHDDQIESGPVGNNNSITSGTGDGHYLTWTNFDVILRKNGQKLVDNASGFVRGGRILALMGPSGAGKTTLLNGLAGRAPYAELNGDVKFAGHKLTSDDLTYVPQFDQLNPAMTVMQHITLVGRLTNSDEAAMLGQAKKLISVLGLQSKKDIKVSDLSGGEKKRLSIGVGLISNPKVLFLDEPTTGLDSTAAYSIVSYLVKIARFTNVAVILTIHQPSALVFQMLDDLCLLEKGKLAYIGTIPDATPYFEGLGLKKENEQENDADYYLDTIQTENKGDNASWSEAFHNSRAGKNFEQALEVATSSDLNTKESSSQSKPSMLVSQWIMFKQFMTLFATNPGYFVSRFYALILIAVFQGTLYLDLQPDLANIPLYSGALFSTAIAVMLTAISGTSLFCDDRREAVDRIANGFYNPGTYVFGQFCASAIFNFFVSIIFTVIFHWLSNLGGDSAERFFYNLVITFGHLLLMDAALNMFIEIIKNSFLCTTSGMIFIGSNMLFSGFFRSRDSVPAAIDWVSSIMPLYYSIRGFTTMIFEGRTFQPGNVSGKEILDRYFNISNVNAWGMIGVLLAYVVLFRCVQYFLFAIQTGRLLPGKVPLLSPGVPLFGVYLN